MTNYYNDNAREFFEGTAYVDMSGNYKPFLEYLPDQGRILDAGCGSGRDTLAFKKLGYQVEAIDASAEMVKLAEQLTDQPVKLKTFQEIDEREVYDGIWASASLLHVKQEELAVVLKKLHEALKDKGVLYASFKYGDFAGERKGRYFHDLNEDMAKKIFTDCEYQIKAMWITGDVRAGREDEKWLNIVAGKSVKDMK